LSASASTGREVVQTSKAVGGADWWNAIHLVETSNAAEDALNGMRMSEIDLNSSDGE